MSQITESTKVTRPKKSFTKLPFQKQNPQNSLQNIRRMSDLARWPQRLWHSRSSTHCNCWPIYVKPDKSSGSDPSPSKRSRPLPRALRHPPRPSGEPSRWSFRPDCCAPAPEPVLLLGCSQVTQEHPHRHDAWIRRPSRACPPSPHHHPLGVPRSLTHRLEDFSVAVKKILSCRSTIASATVLETGREQKTH